MGGNEIMKRPTIVPSIIVLAFVLSSCVSAELTTAEITSPAASTVIEPGPSDIAGAVDLAQSQRMAGDFDGATATLSQLVLIAPDDPRVLAEYGKTLVDRGESADAMAFLQRAIELNPGEWSFYSAQGVALAQSGNFRAAQMAFGRALTLKPDDPVVLNNFALAHLQAGNFDQAEALLLRASLGEGPLPKIAQNLALVRQMRASQLPSVPPAAIDIPPAAPAATREPVADIPPVASAATSEPAADVPPVTSAVASEPVANIPPVYSAAATEPAPDDFAVAPDEPTEVSTDTSPAMPGEAREIETPAAMNASPVEIPEENLEVANLDPVPMQEPVLEISEDPVDAPIPLAPALEPAKAAESSMEEMAAQAEEPSVQNELIEAVELEEVEAPPAVVESEIWLPTSGPIYLQVGAFASQENTGRFFDKLETLDPQIALTPTGERIIHRVIVGPYADRNETHAALASLGELGIDDVQVLTRLPGEVMQRDEIDNDEPTDVLADGSTNAPAEVQEAAPSLRFSESLQSNLD